MPGLPFPSMNQDTPESIVDNYLQQGMQTLREKYVLQWDEVVKRGDVLGERKQREMLSEIDFKAKQEIQELQQTARRHGEELSRVDRLAQQSGFDASEAKWRMVLSPEEIAMKFPKEQAPRSVADQFSELDIYENKLAGDAGNFFTDPGGKRIKEPLKFWFAEKKTKPMLKVYDPDLEPKFDEEKGTWVSGGYRDANQGDIRNKLLLDRELQGVRQAKQELLSQPDIATRIRGPMLRVQRDAKNTSLATKIEEAKTPVQQSVTASGSIRVRSPDGKVGSIPAEDWEEAQRNGYTRVQ